MLPQEGCIKLQIIDHKTDVRPSAQELGGGIFLVPKDKVKKKIKKNREVVFLFSFANIFKANLSSIEKTAFVCLHQGTF